jgi:hypothetical protein
MTTKQTIIGAGLTAVIGGAVLLNVGQTPEAVGPAGIIDADNGSILVLGGTNRQPVIVFKEITTPNQHVVGRYVHDRDVYGDSVLMVAGGECAPLDHQVGHMMFAKNVSETNKWVIGHTINQNTE